VRRASPLRRLRRWQTWHQKKRLRLLYHRDVRQARLPSRVAVTRALVCGAAGGAVRRRAPTRTFARRGRDAHVIYAICT